MVAKTDTTPYKGRASMYAAAAVIALIVFGATASMAVRGVASWEQTIFGWLNDQPSGLTATMIGITFLGSQWMAAASVLGAFLLRYYRLAWRLALSIVIADALSWAAKTIVGRDRPAGLLDDVQVRVQETHLGFPSNHTMTITVIALTLLPYLPRKWRWGVLAVIAAVAFTRLYLGVHLPLDIIGGFTLGIIVVAAVRIMPQPLRVLLRID